MNKIVFIINSPFPNYAGGIETWLFNVTERLCKEYDITIISTKRKDLPILFKNINKKIRIEQVETLKSFKLLNPFIRSYFALLDFYFTSKQMSSKLNEITSNDEETFVIALDSVFCLKAGLIARSINPKIKVISSIRGPHGQIWSNRFPLFSKNILKAEKRLLKKADCVWANGFDTIDIYKKKGILPRLMKNGINYERIHQISSDSERPLEKKEKFKIVSIGTLIPIKGIYELIESAARLIKDYNCDVKLIFVGKGDQTVYRKFAEKHEIQDHVFFKGHSPNPNQFLTGKSIAACLSGGSGMSMAAIESMVSGKPVIAWDSPVYRQFNRNSQTMLLVKEKNIDDLTQGFLKIFKDYDRYLEIGKNAMLEAKNYDWSIVCNDLKENLHAC